MSTCRAPEIMQPPGGEGFAAEVLTSCPDDRVKLGLEFGVSSDRATAVVGKNQIAVTKLWELVEQLASQWRQRHRMGPASLHAFVRDRPNAIRDLGSTHLGYGSAPLASQEQHPDECAVDLGKRTGRLPDNSDLVHRQKSRTLYLFGRRLEPMAWRHIQFATLDRPSKELADGGERSVGCRTAAFVGDVVDKRPDLTTLNVGGRPTGKSLQKTMPEKVICRLRTFRL
jgi:hypothetical protein